jgi:hypothetical protein
MQNQKNPFEDAFETGGYESPHGENNRESTTSNNSERRTNNSNNGSKESSSAHNKNDGHNNNDKSKSESDSTSSKVNNKKANQPNDNQSATETIPTRQPTRNDQSKIPLQLPKASTSNERLPNGKMKEVSRNCSIRGNKTTPDTKRQASSRLHTERKPLTSTRIPNKVPYVQNSVIKYQDVGKERAEGFRAIRPGSKPKQANVNPSHICVSDLESVLGANVTELREIIMKYKSEKADTAENSQGIDKVAGSKVNPQRMNGDNLVDGKKSRCKNNKSKEEKSEMVDNKGNCDIVHCYY